MMAFAWQVSANCPLHLLNQFETYMRYVPPSWFSSGCFQLLPVILFPVSLCFWCFPSVRLSLPR
jgi:hypothetical protein